MRAYSVFPARRRAGLTPWVAAGLVGVLGDYLAAELALDQGHAAEVIGHRGRHVLVVEVEILLVVG